MSDFSDPELFARPKPKPKPKRREVWPVASFSCILCGALDEVKEPAPSALDCWNCREPESLKRWSPPSIYLPPRDGGRYLTELERRGMELDSRAG